MGGWFRTAGRLAWVHSASAGKLALFTVRAKRGKDGMKAAVVLPSFAGIAVHDAQPEGSSPGPARTPVPDRPASRNFPGAGRHGQDPAGAAEGEAAAVPGQAAGPRLEYL